MFFRRSITSRLCKSASWNYFKPSTYFSTGIIKANADLMIGDMTWWWWQDDNGIFTSMFKHAKGFGESALLGLQILQVFSNERVILPRGKHFGALPSRLLAALAKQNKRFVSSRKHVERTTTWRKKKRYPLHNSF